MRTRPSLARLAPLAVVLVGIAPRTEPREGEIDVALARFGREGRMLDAAPARPRPIGPEVHLSRAPGVTEWWRSVTPGLEHGVTLDERPIGDGPLRLELSVGAAVRVEPTTDSGAVALIGADERARYSGLVAVDASGARIPAQLSSLGDRIAIEVDDRGARYPLVVDPVLAFDPTPEATLTLVGCGRLVSAPAIDAAGSLVLVGCPSSDSSPGLRGAVSVLSRTGSAWTLGAPIVPVSASQDGLGAHVSLAADGSRAAVMTSAGVVVIFSRSGTAWSEEHSIGSPAGLMYPDCDVAMSHDGLRVLVGRASRMPATEMYVRSGSTWGLDAGWPSSAIGMSALIRADFSPDGVRLLVANDGGTQVFVRSGTSWSEEAVLGTRGSDGVALTNDRAFVDATPYDRTGSSWAMLPGDVGCTSVGGVHSSDDGAVVTDGSCVFSRDAAGSATYEMIDFDTSGFDWRVPSGDGRRVVSVRGALVDTPVVIHRLEPGRSAGSTCTTDAECAGGVCDTGICCGACGAVAGGACVPVEAGEVCRTADDERLRPCDPVERCDGTSTDCPLDVRLAEGATCSDPAACATGGRCMLESRELLCAGAAPAAAGTICRAATDTCDAPEVCDGSAAGCPPDVLLSGVECRPAAAACDSAEVCLGTSATCPPDQVEAAGMACRVSIDLSCDPTESCDGTSTACPADVNTCAPGPDAPAAGADGGTSTEPPPRAAGCSCRLGARRPGAIVLALALALSLRRRGVRSATPRG